MDKPLKLSMAVPISTKSAGRLNHLQRVQRERRQRQNRLILGLLAIAIFGGGFLAYETGRPQARPDDAPSAGVPILAPAATNTPIQAAIYAAEPTATLPVSVTPVPVEPTPTIPASIPTQAAKIQYEKDAPILYYAQSGDSIGVLAVRFGVEVTDITSTAPIPAEGFIPEGQLLLIPSRLEETSSRLKLLPDSEVVNSPSSIDFDMNAFVNEAGGFLASYQEYVYGNGVMSGADIIKKIALEFSIHPRLLLTLLEYESHWVYDAPENEFRLQFPLGLQEEGRVGLYRQLETAAGMIETGYYGWREGTMVVLTFPDGTVLRLASELNCGTVGLMSYYAQKFNFENWAAVLYGQDGILGTYQNMFGDPWVTAQDYEPLFTPDVLQPELILPFQENIIWSMTVGPHAAWGAADVRAALDFAPPSSAPGCETNYAWVVASAAGLVVRSENGTVVLDLDGDGYEQTGWNLIYLHIASWSRVPVGTWVEKGDKLGHPSCEGGIATGTHLHFVRKYNGEWVPAEGPLSFNLEGWKAKAGTSELGGWLVKGDQIIKASLVGGYISQIQRGQ